MDAAAKAAEVKSIWADARDEAAIDIAARRKLREGCWIVRRAPGFPETPARIWRIDHEPGEPSNRLDRWPPWIWMGEIGGLPCDPYEVAVCRSIRPISEGEYRYLAADLGWTREWQPSDPRLKPQRMASLADLPPITPSSEEK